MYDYEKTAPEIVASGIEAEQGASVGSVAMPPEAKTEYAYIQKGGDQLVIAPLRDTEDTIRIAID